MLYGHIILELLYTSLELLYISLESLYVTMMMNILLESLYFMMLMDTSIWIWKWGIIIYPHTIITNCVLIEYMGIIIFFTYNSIQNICIDKLVMAYIITFQFLLYTKYIVIYYSNNVIISVSDSYVMHNYTFDTILFY